ncbi:MAG: hypothetical protein V2I56_08585 [Desulfobacteraceae bacterium]|nr:hypothetical protein [Desulfobacteraceae bacterium]
MKSLTRQVLQNCDISDAKNAGLYSICGLALRLRDLYKWEKQLPPWEERDSSEILDWIEAKENRWEAFAENDYKELSLFGQIFDPFDSDGVNAVLEPHDIYYGAGYARGLRPTFFLAEVDKKIRSNGYHVYTLGRELARDLLTIPAMSQNKSVLLRQESANLFLWDQIFYIKKSGRAALNFALEHLGIAEKEPTALRQHLPEIFAAVKDIYIYHELGEIQDTAFDRQSWREMVAAFPFSPVEFIARALKDLLADTGQFGTLHHIIQGRDSAALAFYVAFIDGLAKEFFPQIILAFQEFARSEDWLLIERAVADGYQIAKKHTILLLNICREGVQKDNLPWAEAEIQTRLLGQCMQKA